MSTFPRNQLTSITLGENFRNLYYISDPMFPHNFANFYELQKKAAGTYTWNGRIWTFNK